MRVELDEENTESGSIIFLLQICVLCARELDCAPGNLVMKTHYLSHYPPSCLLELVSREVGIPNGKRLRCPYLECHTAGEVGCLYRSSTFTWSWRTTRMLMEKDNSPGITEVLSIMYDFENYQEKKVSMGANVSESAFVAEEVVVDEEAQLGDSDWTNPFYTGDEKKNISFGLTDLRELRTHYTGCFYNLGRFEPYLDPGEGNRDFEGKAVDEDGCKYSYA